MAKSEETTGKKVKIQLKFDQDSRKGTYHRYQIVKSDHGMVGTIYFPKGKDMPDHVVAEVLETE
jgi:hypothetical protein